MTSSPSRPARFAVVEREGIVERIDVFLSIHWPPGPASDTATLDEAAKQLSLQNLLAASGPPSQVLISVPAAQAEPGSGWLYGIWLYYPEKGMAVVYEGEGLELAGDLIRVCPLYEGTYWISLFLADPSTSSSIEEVTEGQFSIPSQLAEGMLAEIQSATSLSPQLFAETIQTGGSSNCFYAAPTK